MRVSLNWLGELVELPVDQADPQSLAQKLTFAGLEVERIDHLGQGLERVLIARILSSQPHSKADRLSVTEVDAGGRRLQIVCGAKNYKVGDLVPLAPAGTELPGGLRIEEAELRGVRSLGMLCSATELGLTLPGQEDGLWILGAGTPGQPLVEALPLQDTVFEINVTPNRADCLSHLGIARELAALTGGMLRASASAASLPSAPAAPGKTGRALAIPRLENPERCGRFLGQPATAAGLHAPSPFVLRYRLQACGVRPIGLAVDVTNYVMLELGQPLHAYDLDRLHQGIVVRRAKAGEKLFTLDGVERTLSVDDLLICDGPLPIGLAGVMGGRETEVSATTQRLYLEAAYFEPGGIRATAKRQGLPSEASHRFERGIDPELQARALARAVSLLQGGPDFEAGSVQSAEGKLPPRRQVRLRPARVAELLGYPVAPTEVVTCLASVGIAAAGSSSTVEALFDIPSHRQDLTEMVDLVSEVGRLQGYSAIPATPPRQGFGSPARTSADRLSEQLREGLTGAGFAETVGYSFLAGDAPNAFADPLGEPGASAPVALINPLAQERGVLRRSLLPSLCELVRTNLAHLTKDAGVAPSVRLYEIARTYAWPTDAQRPEGPVAESLRLGLVWHGPRFELGWGTARDPADAHDLRGLLETLFGRLRIPVTVLRADPVPSFLHPRSAVEIWSGLHRLGIAGELHPGLARGFDWPRQLLLAELDLEALQRVVEAPRAVAVPRFPAVLRDLAFIVPRDLPQESLAQVLRAAGGGLLESLLLFDVYEGAPLAAGEKSFAYSLRFRASDRTLTDVEVVTLQTAMVAAAERELSAKLRTA